MTSLPSRPDDLESIPMDNLTIVFWILLYIFVLGFVPALVVFFATFITGLGFFLRDLKYDIKQMIQDKTSGSGKSL